MNKSNSFWGTYVISLRIDQKMYILPSQMLLPELLKILEQKRKNRSEMIAIEIAKGFLDHLFVS